MKIPYGISDYRAIKEEEYYYVDKTMYLEKLEDMGKTLLYLRPRRFGKTLFTSMMYYYYDISSKDKFDTLFKDTYVYNKSTPNKNNYYVLKFDFSGMNIDSSDKEKIELEFKNKIIIGLQEFIKHYNIEYIINEESNITSIFSSFLTNINIDKKLYIIIDEYDNFTNSILSNNVDMFRQILGNEGFIKAFYARIKEYCGMGIVDRVFITGVCSISLDSMTSGFNIATNITTDFRFNSMTALTHDEVKLLLKDIPNNEKYFKEMLENYDGYSFGEESGELVFNPTLAMYYVRSLVELGKPPLRLLDSNIITNYSQLKKIISLGDYKEILADIFDNGEIVSNLVVNYSEKTTFNRNDIISLLFYFGYLTIKDINQFSGYIFTIPNKVIKSVYGSYYMSILGEDKIYEHSDMENDAIADIYYNGSVEKLCEYVSYLLKNADNRIYINFNEKDLQLLMYSILIKYQELDVKLENHTNDKFVDIYIKAPNYNIIVELKYLKKKESRKLRKVKEEAIGQMNNYNPDKDNLRKYVTVFVGSNYELEEVEV